MPSSSFRKTLADYVLSGHSFLHRPTTEITRFLAELKALADDGRQVFTWSHAVGWRDAEGNPPSVPSGSQLGQPDPQRVPQEILDLPDESLFVLRDSEWYLQYKTFSYADVVIAWLADTRHVLASTRRTVIFLGPDFELPAAVLAVLPSKDQPERTGRALHVATLNDAWGAICEAAGREVSWLRRASVYGGSR